ncbi:MAG: DUF5052 family protein [Clostridia bacterium]|nr:DUF5052 family protein [Clostridia bacterium]
MVCLVAFIFLGLLMLSGCALVGNVVHSLTGSLIGVGYNIEEYDNYGTLTLTASGEKINITANKVYELGVDSAGNITKNYTLSSVLTITIDGYQWESCGNTLIFAQKGLKPDVNFSEVSNISSNSFGIGDFTSVAEIVNRYKNDFGKPMVVVIRSQLGQPICAFSGKEVYWEVCNDLPKMTKLMIDGYALYIHRANFDIFDKKLL